MNRASVITSLSDVQPSTGLPVSLKAMTDETEKSDFSACSYPNTPKQPLFSRILITRTEQAAIQRGWDFGRSSLVSLQTHAVASGWCSSSLPRDGAVATTLNSSARFCCLGRIILTQRRLKRYWSKTAGLLTRCRLARTNISTSG